MLDISSDATVFLVPAGSVEAKKILELTIEDEGLTETEVNTQLYRSNSPAEPPEVNELYEKWEKIQEELSRKRDRRAELESRIENREHHEGSLTSDREFGTGAYSETGGASEKRKKSIENEIGNLESELEEIEYRIEEQRKKPADPARVDSAGTEQLTSEFDRLTETVDTDSEGVYCWPLAEETTDQYNIRSGDIFLFYCGNDQYRYAGRVSGVHNSPTLWDLIKPDGDKAPQRNRFVVFDQVVPIQIRSSLVADLGDYDLDAPVNFVRVGEAFSDEVRARYGSLEEFVDEARNQGIRTLRSKGGGSRLDQFRQTEITSASGSDTLDQQGGSTQPSASDDSRHGGGVHSESSPSVDNETTVEGDTEGTQRPDEDEDEEIKRVEARNEWEHLRNLLQRHKLVKIVGPSNTGKRQLVSKLVDEWFNDVGSLGVSERVRYVNFHSSIDYEEFVLGDYSSEKSNRSSLVTGAGGEFVDIAAANTQQFRATDGQSSPKHLLVIEDFDTADAAPVFGALWKPLYGDERGSNAHATVAGPNTELWIPDEFYVVGIIDTNDLATTEDIGWSGNQFVSHWTQPDIDALDEIYGLSNVQRPLNESDDFGRASVLAFKELNSRIRENSELGPQYLFGHLSLLSENGEGDLEPLDTEELCETWQYELFPLLWDYQRDVGDSLSETLLEGCIAREDQQLSLASLQSELDIVRGIVTSLAEQRS